MKTYTTNFQYTQLSIDALFSGDDLTFLETETGKPYYSKGKKAGRGEEMDQTAPSL